MGQLSFRLILQTDDATGKLKDVRQEAEGVEKAVETPKEVKLSADKALGTIRDVKIAIDGVLQVISGVTSAVNGFLDEALAARQARILAAQTFGDEADEMSRFADEMQRVTNEEGDKLLALMAKLSMTYKLTGEDIRKLTPYLLDFTEANKATGMTVETAFDLMGKALNGHTEMLGRYGIELDDTRLKSEGVAYLVEKLGQDYDGTAKALADLRLQNRNAWGDIKESIGDMIQVIITPLLKILSNLMQAYQNLNPIAKGFVTGLALGIPIIVATASAISGLTAVINALKVAINPLAGLVSLAVGAVTVLGFTLAASSTQIDKLSESTQSLTQRMGDVNHETNVEVEKFKLLANRLLEIKGATNATSAEKKEMRGIIQTLNNEYKQYLGNLNLETAGYNEVATAAKNAAENIAKKKLAEGFGSLAAEQAGKVARAKLRLEASNVYSQQENEDLALAREGGGQGGGADWANQIHRQHQERIDFFEKEYKKEVAEYQRIVKAYTDAMTAADMSITGGIGSGGGGQGSTTIDSEKEQYLTMVKEIEDLMKSETQKIEEEYQRRLGLIKKYTAENSAEQKAQISDLDAWKDAKSKEAATKEKTLQDKLVTDGLNAEKAKYEKQIEYYSNLENLGISSYDALKKTMSDYYAWAKEHLPKEEAELILAQMREANLKWGKHRADMLYAELQHQQELADINESFHKKNLEISGNSFALQMQAIDDYYEANKQKLLDAGVTEVEITKQIEAQKTKIKFDSVQAVASGVGSILGKFADMQDKESKRGFMMWKGLAYAQAMVDIPASAIAAYKSMAGISPILGAIAAAAAVAAGMKQVAEIQKAEYKPKAAKGMYIEGPSHAGGGVPIEAEGGEFITNKDRVNALGRKFFEFINFAPIGDVKGMLAGIKLPSLSVPLPDYAFATGGSIAQESKIYGLLETLIKKIDTKPNIVIHVDPLTGKVVELSELVDEGRIKRSVL